MGDARGGNVSCTEEVTDSQREALGNEQDGASNTNEQIGGFAKEGDGTSEGAFEKIVNNFDKKISDAAI